MQPPRLAAILVLCFVLAPCSARAAEKSERPVKPVCADASLKGYQLEWHDEFDGDALNPKEWSYRTGDRYWSANLADNVSVSGGLLRIALKKEKSGREDYTAGGVISKRTFKYGYFEARLRCPPDKGWHTSFWLDPYHVKTIGSAQEIDICEQDSIDRDGYSCNLHRWKPTHKWLGGKHVKTPDLASEFHVFGCEFTPGKIRFFFDGKPVETKDATGLHDDQMNVWLTSIAANLRHTDHVDDAHLPAYAEFDWVRVYQRHDAKPAD